MKILKLAVMVAFIAGLGFFMRIQVASANSASEFLGRGLICLPRDGHAYCSWRLLPTDDANTKFNIYRSLTSDESFEKVNADYITNSTNYYDGDNRIVSGTDYYYKVKTVNAAGSEVEESNLFKVTAGVTKNFIDIPIFENTTIHSVVPADLNGDGMLDFITKTPNWDACHPGGPDAANIVGHSNTPTKVSALISNNGAWETAWVKDILFKECNLGEDFSVNPLLVWDLDGDLNAEIILRYGVNGETLAILDGKTGGIRASVPWPLHNPELTQVGDLSLDRHYATIARLRDMNGDGIADPFIVIQNGLYGSFQRFTAYYFNGTTVNLVNDLPLRGEYMSSRSGGLGTHGLPTADIDFDGKDEVIPCGGAIDDDFRVMWEANSPQHVNTAHNDVCYTSDIRPELLGLETFMGEEGHADGQGSAMLVDAQGKILWSVRSDVALHYDGWTQGWCAKLSATSNGIECSALDKDEEDETDAHTTINIFNSSGTDVTANFPSAYYPPANYPPSPLFDWNKLNKVIRQAPVDWINGDGIKELYFHGSPSGNPYSQEYSGWYHTILADILGDSREEVVGFNQSAIGFFRITSNVENNNYRRVTPLTDRNYRSAVGRVGVGYRTNSYPDVSGQMRNDVVYSANPPTCASFTYAPEACQPNGTQKLNVVSMSPAGCINGTPTFSQACNYVAPIYNEVDPAGTYFEAENFTRTIPAAYNGTFSTETAQTFFNGSGYLKSIGSVGSPSVTEKKEYVLNFPTAGQYNVWIRGHCVNSDPNNGDSVYFGLDGNKLGAIKEYSWLTNPCNFWEWTNIQNNLAVDANTLTISTPGEHVFNIWSREANHLLDGIYLTHSTQSGKVPTDLFHGKIIDPSSNTNPADVNSDGSVNIKDIQVCIKVIAKTDMTFEENCKKVASDFTVANIKDIQEIIKKIINP